jgi:hypothetical protein
MNAHDILADLFQRLNRVASAVKNHVGWVKVDIDVFAPDISDETKQGVSGLLSSL